MKIEFLDKESLLKNLHQIMNLYKSCFDRGLNEKSFLWRYVDNPLEELLFVVAKENNDIIASYSASPNLICNNCNTFKAALSLNTMTHPNYQGKGVFIKLAEQLYEYMLKKDYQMIWGFPNNISNRTFNEKLGWQTIYELPTMTLNLNDTRYLEETAILTDDSSFNLDYSKLETSNIRKIFVRKSNAYLKWRYLNNPDNSYLTLVKKNESKVDAYIIIKEYNDILNIVDYNFINFSDFSILINNAIYYAHKTNKTKVTLWAPINTQIHSHLEKMRFYNDYPIRYFGGKVLKEDGIYEDFLCYKDWSIQLGDNNEY